MRPWPWSWERRKQELAEELETHLRMAIEDRVARGQTPERARAAAMNEMGNLPLLADTTRRYWGWERVEHLAQDVRYALRQLRKSTGYTAVVILTLTLVIGANTAIFGLLYAMLLRSLPVERPDRIVQIKILLSGPSGASEEPSDMVSDAIYDTLAPHQSVFSGMCQWNQQQMNLHDQDGSRPVPSASVNGGCFSTLGLHAALGRLLTDTDDQPGGAPEGFPVVLGYDYWRTHFNANPAVIGRVMNFGASFRAKAARGVVVGVMEPGFSSVQIGTTPWIYVPSEMTDPLSQHNLGSFDHALLARLKDGVAPQQAQAQVETIFSARLKQEKQFPYYIFDGRGFTPASQAHLLVTPGRTGYSYLRTYYQKPLFLVEGMVGLSLLVACAYLAMLASTRALARRRELAVRIALGASRGRVAAQLCYESGLLALAGSCLGVLFAWGAERVLLALISIGNWSEQSALQAGPELIVLLFTLCLAAFTVLLSSVWPAWRASRLDPATDIKEGGISIAGRRSTGAGAWLVPMQIGFSLVMVVVAALMASTVARLIAVDPGFRTSGVTFLSADFSPRTEHGKKEEDQAVSPALYIAVLERIRHSPGVDSAGISQAHPLAGGTYMENASSKLPSGETRVDPSLTSLSVTPGYFQTLGIPMLVGRDFTLDDREKASPVCILSRNAAEYFFPGGDAVGRVLTMHKNISVRVIAVVGDTLYSDLRGKAPRIIYESYLQVSWNPFAKIAVQSRDTAAAVSAVRNAFRELAPDVAVDEPVGMADLVHSAMGRERIVALLSGFFALLTLALTAIGLYGVLSYAVVRRRTEIGVRMALGASPTRVMRMVMREALVLVFPGILLGAAGAWAATRLLRSLLFGVKPLDPWICAVSLAALLAAAILACLLPARRAAGYSPMDSLRFE